eukprot:187052-Rhodomonas_salina.1
MGTAEAGAGKPGTRRLVERATADGWPPSSSTRRWSAWPMAERAQRVSMTWRGLKEGARALARALRSLTSMQSAADMRVGSAWNPSVASAQKSAARSGARNCVASWLARLFRFCARGKCIAFIFASAHSVSTTSAAP